jgi:hypothetical protein
MQIQIQEMHPARPGKKMASVVAGDGQRYGIWPEQLVNLRVGGKFDVEVESWESNGRTLQKITKVTPASEVTPSPQHNSSGQIARGLDGEAEFVGRALHALILKGEVCQKEIAITTQMLRNVWRATSSN